jgi:UDP-N-acetylglucosamine 1-carboxyvinyltransferase
VLKPPAQKSVLHIPSQQQANVPSETIFCIERSPALQGVVNVSGAKNAVLVSIASTLLVHGKTVLRNVPASADVLNMIELLTMLGAQVDFSQLTNTLTVDAQNLTSWAVHHDIMKKMRASVLVVGPLLQRFGRAEVALPGGCVIGPRPIDFHLKAFLKFGVECVHEADHLSVRASSLRPAKVVLEYPSVGATENILMLAAQIPGTSCIVNAAIEPEVMNLIEILQAMGACIRIMPPAIIEIEGVPQLYPAECSIIPDRLEAGGILLAAAISKGSVSIKNARAEHMEVFLEKLSEMGHSVTVDGRGIHLVATHKPKAVSYRTAPYPGFPTDLQAPMMVAQCLAEGKSVVHETVYENRFLHIPELKKLGALIEINGDRAHILGVDKLYGAHVIATDIRASCALVLAGMAAEGTTHMAGLHHWRRGYDALELKLATMGAKIKQI